MKRPSMTSSSQQFIDIHATHLSSTRRLLEAAIRSINVFRMYRCPPWLSFIITGSWWWLKQSNAPNIRRVLCGGLRSPVRMQDTSSVWLMSWFGLKRAASDLVATLQKAANRSPKPKRSFPRPHLKTQSLLLAAQPQHYRYAFCVDFPLLSS